MARIRVDLYQSNRWRGGRRRNDRLAPNATEKKNRDSAFGANRQDNSVTPPHSPGVFLRKGTFAWVIVVSGSVGVGLMGRRVSRAPAAMSTAGRETSFLLARRRLATVCVRVARAVDATPHYPVAAWRPLHEKGGDKRSLRDTRLYQPDELLTRQLFHQAFHLEGEQAGRD